MHVKAVLGTTGGKREWGKFLIKKGGTLFGKMSFSIPGTLLAKGKAPRTESGSKGFNPKK